MRWPPWRRRAPRKTYHELPGWPAGTYYPDSLADDLRHHLAGTLYAVDPAQRQGSHWVMSGEWWNEVRSLDVGPSAFWHPALDPAQPPVLLGLAVQIRDGAGPPHLEPGEAWPS